MSPRPCRSTTAHAPPSNENSESPQAARSNELTPVFLESLPPDDEDAGLGLVYAVVGLTESPPPPAMAAGIDYFAYGTLQKGFANWPDLADELGDPVGRFCTVQPHGLVVPIQPGCANPGCGLLHRMAAMVAGIDGSHVEGDLFEIDRSALAAIDRLEAYDPSRQLPGLYVRTEIEVVAAGGGEIRLATAYSVREPDRWRALVASGRAELLVRYEHHLADARPKLCCVENPGHRGPHDVIDPLASLP